MPLYEEHQARLDFGYSLADWQVLDPNEKALTIAMRRIHLALENIQAEAQIREAKRNAKTRR